MTPISILVKASILLLAAAAVDAVFRRRTSAAMRHLWWTFAIVGLLLLPILPVLLPGWTAIRLSAPAIAQSTPGLEPPGILEQPARENGVKADGFSDVAAAAPTAAAVNARTDRARAPQRSSAISPSTVVLGIYAVGVVLLLGRLAAERLSIRRLARRAKRVDDLEWKPLLRECAQHLRVRRAVPLLRSLDQTMPMAFGIRGGAILVPAISDTWSEERRRAVLLHELAHVARYDCLTQALAAIACAVYWVHPGVWWIARRLRIERELACDDCVLSAGASARNYAGHLLELAYSLTAKRAPTLAVCMAGPRQLEDRMLAILDAARNRATPAPRTCLVGAAIMAMLLIPVATATTTAIQPGTNNQNTAAATTEARSEQAPGLARLNKQGPIDEPVPATWEIRPAGGTGLVHFRLTEGNSSYGSTIRLDRLVGVDPALLARGVGPVYFSIARDAGTFTFEGFVRDGAGAGTYTFAPSASYAAELVKRGLEQPKISDQRLLARQDIGLDFLDELGKQGYPRPTIADLIRLAQHGVDLVYLREMGGLGYRVQGLDALVTLRDHGVTPEFVRGLEKHGFSRLSPDDLRRVRDHGVDAEYIDQLAQFGITPQTLDVLVAARDHGIDADYVRDMRALGQSLTLDELKRTRDHGVDPEYIRGMSELGYQRLSLDALIDARNHGIDPEYVRDMRALGYPLTLDELKQARNHGVDGDYIRGMSALGYQHQSLDALIRLRNHGVDPDYVRALKDVGYSGLSVDDLIALRNAGVTPELADRSNISAGVKLTVERLRARAAKAWKQ